MHVQQDCTCQPVGPESQSLAAILEKQQLPLITFGSGEDGEITVGVEPWEQGTTFIAVSHALSDGLCNLQDAKLPVCQLRALASASQALLLSKFNDCTTVASTTTSKLASRRQSFQSNITQGPRIWIDVLCIPPKQIRDFNGGSVTASAIRSMQDVVTHATALLVWDSDILRLKPAVVAPERVALVIQFSSWGNRLWTLYEALRARRVFFQFAEGQALELGDSEDERQKITEWTRYDLLRQQLRRHDGGRCSLTWKDLRPMLDGRRTNYASDADAVFALLLNKPIAGYSSKKFSQGKLTGKSDGQLLDLYRLLFDRYSST